MRFIANSAILVWLSTLVTILLFAVLWKYEFVQPHGPHGGWAIGCAALIGLPLLMLTLSVLWTTLRGPFRLRAMGWFLIGVTPILGVGAYVAKVINDAHQRVGIPATIPNRLLAMAASSVIDVEARTQLTRWTRGEHAILMDKGQTPNAERLVAEMDNHLKVMAKVLGKPVPSLEFPWVRGTVLGFEGRAMMAWAACGTNNNVGELVHVDRHEMAHTLITMMAGLDQDPPSLLAEGWAEYHSTDRNRQILNLAKKQKQGDVYTMQDLVTSHWYNNVDSPVYWEGCPLVQYLIEHYGGEKFLKLYSDVRKLTFKGDAQRILGDSWEKVEEDFWKWLETQVATIEKEMPAQEKKIDDSNSLITAKFADSVNKSDWQEVVKGIKEANPDFNPLEMPKDLAFKIERYQSVHEKDEKEQPIKRIYQFKLHASFENGNFSIHGTSGGQLDHFLQLSEGSFANLERNKDGKIRGRIGDYRSVEAKDSANDTLQQFGGIDAHSRWTLGLLLQAFKEIDLRIPDELLRPDGQPLRTTWTIEKVSRPVDGKNGRWTIVYTIQADGDKAPLRGEVELDPQQRWWITRRMYDTKDRSKKDDTTILSVESTREYQKLSDQLVVSSSKEIWTNPDGTIAHTTESQLKPLDDSEKQQLRNRVDQAIKAREPDAMDNFMKTLLAIVIGVPLLGMILLKFSPRPNVT